MTSVDEYLAVLRCQTWHQWPEREVLEVPSVRMVTAEGKVVIGRMALISFLGRKEVSRFDFEETDLGVLLWDGEIPGLHGIRDVVLKAPEDTVEVSLQHRHAACGEIDLLFNFKVEDELVVHAVNYVMHV